MTLSTGFRLLFSYASLPWQCVVQYFYTISIIRKANKELPSSIPNSDKKMLYHPKHSLFYGCLVPNVLHHSIASMHNVRKSKSLATYQALITGIYDDLIDDHQYTLEQMHEVLYGSASLSKEQPSLAHYCRYFFRHIQNEVVNKELFSEIIQPLILAQEKSKLQETEDLTLTQILEITYEKGGLALLFYRTAFSAPCSRSEYDFIYALGGLMQLTNDINDALKDKLHNSSTLMTSTANLKEIQSIFWDQIHSVNQKWWAFQSNPPILHLARILIILTRSLITLHRYSQYQEDAKTFDIHLVPKHKVIQGLHLPISPIVGFQYLKKLYKVFTVSPFS